MKHGVEDRRLLIDRLIADIKRCQINTAGFRGNVGSTAIVATDQWVMNTLVNQDTSLHHYNKHTPGVCDPMQVHISTGAFRYYKDAGLGTLGKCITKAEYTGPVYDFDFLKVEIKDILPNSKYVILAQDAVDTSLQQTGYLWPYCDRTAVFTESDKACVLCDSKSSPYAVWCANHKVRINCNVEDWKMRPPVATYKKYDKAVKSTDKQAPKTFKLIKTQHYDLYGNKCSYYPSTFSRHDGSCTDNVASV